MRPHDWIGELLSTYGTKPLILVEGEDISTQQSISFATQNRQ